MSLHIHELGHIVLYVENLERSAEFYGKVLGWKRLPGKLGFPGGV
jgi:catechol 2,3-dioxygenase-like lactoylglutathione lyase family enzyme